MMEVKLMWYDQTIKYTSSWHDYTIKPKYWLEKHSDTLDRFYTMVTNVQARTFLFLVSFGVFQLFN